uniref:Reverse transcriptase domain-containing protein n=1 Tax=Tanacetum cinerariifolium TaxID=118510 RepID=A0A6L2K0X9_TANCI|nr:hypothetical protein [Tanacetum cinerariifolium]
MMTSDQFFRLEKVNPYDHIRWFNKITSTIKYKDVPKSAIKLMLFPFSLTGAARRWLEKELPYFILTWEDLVSKFINEFFPPQERQISVMKFLTFNNSLMNHSLNSAASGNLLERRTQDVLTIIENKSKVHNSRNKSIVSQVKSNDANTSSSSEIAMLTHAVNQQTSVVTTAMTTILKQFQATPPPAFVKSVEEICVTCGGAYLYYQCLAADGNTCPEFQDNIKGYVSADAVNYNQALLSNKEKLLELANTPLNENYLAVILKKLPKKLEDPGKFLILCGFIELKCKALADLAVSIDLMPLFVLKNLGLPELISTRMTLELANQAICTPAGIARDVFVPVRKFAFPSDFFIVDYKSDPRVPLILGRPFLRTAHALIDVHGEEMILCDSDERLTLNMRHDTSSYSNQKESINILNIFNDSYEDYLEDLFETNHLSGNPTFSSHTDLTSPEVKADIFDSKEDIMFIDEHALDYSFPPLYDDYDDDLDEFESSDFLPSPEYDSFLIEDFSKIDALPSTNNEDKVFNPGILIQENLSESNVQATPDKNVKKIAISYASLILEDFDPPLYEHPFYKEVLGSKTLLSFSFENEEKNFKPGILTSKGVHSSLLPKLSHRCPKAFKVIKIFESPMKIFPCSFGEDIRILDVSFLPFYPP